MYYITAYATKIDRKNREMYALLHAPLAKYKVDAEDTATRQFINKLQMQMTRLHHRGCLLLDGLERQLQDTLLHITSQYSFMYFLFFHRIL